MIKTFEELNDSLNNYLTSCEPVGLQPKIIKLKMRTAYRLQTEELKPRLNRSGIQKLEAFLHPNDHPPPHFHLKNQSGDQEATFSIKDGILIEHKTAKRFSQKIINHIREWCSKPEIKNFLNNRWVSKVKKIP